MSEESKEIKVVSGDGTDLTISPVYKHLSAVKPKPKEEKEKKIIIPEEKKKTSTDSENKD